MPVDNSLCCTIFSGCFTSFIPWCEWDHKIECCDNWWAFIRAPCEFVDQQVSKWAKSPGDKLTEGTSWLGAKLTALPGDKMPPDGAETLARATGLLSLSQCDDGQHCCALHSTFRLWIWAHSGSSIQSWHGLSSHMPLTTTRAHLGSRPTGGVSLLQPGGPSLWLNHVNFQLRLHFRPELAGFWKHFWADRSSTENWISIGNPLFIAGSWVLFYWRLVFKETRTVAMCQPWLCFFQSLNIFFTREYESPGRHDMELKMRKMDLFFFNFFIWLLQAKVLKYPNSAVSREPKCQYKSDWKSPHVELK